MSMTIGKEARNELESLMFSFSEGQVRVQELGFLIDRILDRCTDADDVAKCRQLLTDDDDSQHEAAKEPVAWAVLSDHGRLYGAFTDKEVAEGYALSNTLADLALRLVPLYTRPPVGLPPGWVAVPVEPTKEQVEAVRDTINEYAAPISVCDAFLDAAPPCPGAVELPDDRADYLQGLKNFARWRQSQGQGAEQEKQGGKDA